MKLEITVTQADIDAGVQHCGTECPVLWAIRRCFAGYGDAFVDRVTRAYIVFRDRTRKRSPKIVQKFCKAFDESGRNAVAPFTFTISMP